MARLGERPIPSPAHRSVLFGNQSIVTLPRPSSEVRRVARIGEHLVSGRCRLVGAPDGGLAKHGREKGEVLSRGRASPNVFHRISPAVRRSARGPFSTDATKGAP